MHSAPTLVPPSPTPTAGTSRILIVDDTRQIHGDFRKILAPEASPDVADESGIFDPPPAAPKSGRSRFEIDSAYQGEEAAAAVAAAVREGRPYAVAFVDMRMPPGWDGIETSRQLWQIDPQLQIVICTAFSDYSWEQTAGHLGESDNWVILKKPFDNVEVLQLAHALSKKWIVTRRDRERLANLSATVRERTTQLERSEERFVQAFHANPIAVTLQTASDGRYLDVNEAFLRLVGRDRKGVLNATGAELHLWASDNVWVDALRSIENRTPFRGHRTQLRAKGGAIRDVLISVERVHVDSEPCLLTSLEDITDRLLLEQQLRQAQKMEAVGQLAAGIAHDFNNVLTVIQAYTEMTLTDATLKTEHRTGLTEVKVATERAGALTRQLLLFSRRPVAPVRPLNLSASLGSLRAMLTRVLPAHVQLEWECDASVPRVLADEANLEQVVMNLVVNARDALAAGGRICVGLKALEIDAAGAARHVEARAGQFVCLSVRDNGAGIDPDALGHIFEPFFTTKPRGQGTGLGLSTVYAIVRQHQGWIEVSTAVGQGTQFEIFLPACTDLPTAAPERPAKPLPTLWGHGERILLVEDEEVVRRATRVIAVGAGYKITEAMDAPSALKAWDAADRPFDLLLTDMVMPNGTTGLELASQLRARHPGLKVILSTGYGRTALADEAEKQGVRLLSKPYDRAILLSAIHDALQSTSARE